MPQHYSEVAAVMLAGGLGTRLRSVLPNTPKILARVGGKPFVYYLLDQLADARVPSVVLCTGHLGEQVQDCLGGSYRGISIHYSMEDSPLGTGGALRLALSQISSKRLLVLNGDSFCGINLADMASLHERNDAKVTIAVSQVDDGRRYGRVEIAEDGQILGFLEKAELAGPAWVSAGIYLMERELVEAIPERVAVSVEREVFPRWTGRGLHGYRTEAKLWDIGVPEAYAQADAEFKPVQATSLSR